MSLLLPWTLQQPPKRFFCSCLCSLLVNPFLHNNQDQLLKIQTRPYNWINTKSFVTCRILCDTGAADLSDFIHNILSLVFLFLKSRPFPLSRASLLLFSVVWVYAYIQPLSHNIYITFLERPSTATFSPWIFFPPSHPHLSTRGHFPPWSFSYSLQCTNHSLKLAGQFINVLVYSLSVHTRLCHEDGKLVSNLSLQSQYLAQRRPSLNNDLSSD